MGAGMAWGKGTMLKEPFGAAECGAEEERTPPVLRPERREARLLGLMWVVDIGVVVVRLVDYGENT
jgi:hypothetical protein